MEEATEIALTDERAVSHEIRKKDSSEESNDQETFSYKLNTILERIRSLPSKVEEIKVPTTKKDVTEVYLKLCKLLKVPEDSSFLSNVSNEKMDLSFHCLGSVGVIAVTKALVYNQAVKQLDLSFNKIGRQSLPCITSLLNQNEYISNLNLSHNDFGKKSAKFLGDLVSVCHSVTTLDLSGNNLGDEEFASIGTALAAVNTIKSLNLSRNDIGVTNGAQFGSCVAKCSALEEIDLSGNHLQDGIKGIFNILKKSSLIILNVSKNDIPDEAMQLLVKGLRGNKTLQELDISSNFISNEGAIALSPGLKRSSLETFKIANNPLQESGAFTLLKAAGPNLKLLDLSGIKVNLAFIKTCINYHKNERELKVLFGSVVRYDLLPEDLFLEDDPIGKSNVISIAQKLAYSKGISLRHVLKEIHSSFLAEQEEIKEGEEEGNKGKERKMKTADLAKGLASSRMALKKTLAKDIATAFSDAEGCVDMWEVISSIPYRPDELAVKIKKKKKEPEEKKKKGKGRGKK